MDAILDRHDDARRSDEISIRELIQGLWGSRAWALGGLLIAGAGAVALTVAMHFSQPGFTTYRQGITFTLQEQINGRYPNGTDFSPNDLRSPAVLQQVYEDGGFADYGVSYVRFASAVSVTPTSPLYEGIIERYRERLTDRTLTFEERRQIETEFSTALGTTLSSNAVVSLTLPDSFGVPQSVGQASVAAIPNVWADIYINQLGVVDLPVPNSTGELISADFVASLDYPIAYDAIAMAFTELRARILAIQQLSGSRNLSEPTSGRTLFDIERDVARLEQFSLHHILAPLTELGLNKSPELTAATYTYQVEDIERQIRLARDNARIIDSILRVAENNAGAGLPPVSGDVENFLQPGQQSVIPATIVQQFGPELVDRLIGMSVENAGIAFRERMLSEKLRYESQALSSTIERDQIVQRLDLIRGDDTLENADRLEEIFVSESTRLVEELNGLWRQVDGILRQANLQRLNYDKQLFKPMPTPASMETTSQLVSQRTLITWGGVAFLGFVGGIAVYFVSRLLRRRVTD